MKLRMIAANSSSQPPILGWMAQNTDEMATIVIGDDRDKCVTCTPANRHYRQKSPDTVLAPAAANNMLVGNGNGTAVETARAPVPHL
jgi:hypothetical protein